MPVFLLCFYNVWVDVEGCDLFAVGVAIGCLAIARV